MKVRLLPPFYKIFDHYRPNTICEIGTHNGKSAVQFVDYCLKINPRLNYVGYDVFDAVKNNEQFHEKEINGKGAGKFTTAKNNLKHRQRDYKKFKFTLHQGFTQDTLTESIYDFVYIDGGHSYETVKHDYEKVKASKVIVFDDYQTEGVKKFFDELVKQSSIPELEFNEALTSKITCWAFLPHPKNSNHVQPVVFNREENL